MSMNKTKIEWCDYTWSPVTGCKHGCSYCYARKIAERFKGSKAWARETGGHTRGGHITHGYRKPVKA